MSTINVYVLEIFLISVLETWYILVAVYESGGYIEDWRKNNKAS